MGKCWERGWSREEKRDNWLNCVSEETEGSNRSQNSSCEGGRIPSSFEVEGEQKRCMNSKFVWGREADGRHLWFPSSQ